MSRIVVTLTLTTLTFAGTTVYFARELHSARQHTDPVPAAALMPAAQPAQIFPPAPRPSSPPPDPTVKSSTLARTEVQGEPEFSEARMKELQLEHSRNLMQRLEDPEQRAEMLAEYRIMMRNSYPRLARALGIRNEDAERLIELLALQQVESLEDTSQCALDPACLSHQGSPRKADERAKEIANLLGPDGQQRFQQYQSSLSERESVSALRTRLPDAQPLPESKAEDLIAALADERQRIQNEAQQRGTGVNGFGNGVGMVYTASDAASPEARIASAQANSERMRRRAAEVLNAEQFRVFDQMQDELLLSMRQQLRQKEQYLGGHDRVN